MSSSIRTTMKSLILSLLIFSSFSTFAQNQIFEVVNTAGNESVVITCLDTTCGQISVQADTTYKELSLKKLKKYSTEKLKRDLRREDHFYSSTKKQFQNAKRDFHLNDAENGVGNSLLVVGSILYETTAVPAKAITKLFTKRLYKQRKRSSQLILNMINTNQKELELYPINFENFKIGLAEMR